MNANISLVLQFELHRYELLAFPLVCPLFLNYLLTLHYLEGFPSLLKCAMSLNCAKTFCLKKMNFEKITNYIVRDGGVCRKTQSDDRYAQMVACTKRIMVMVGVCKQSHNNGRCMKTRMQTNSW